MKKGFLVLAAMLSMAVTLWAADEDDSEPQKPSEAVDAVYEKTDLGGLKTPNIIGLDTSFIDVNGYRDLQFDHAFVYLGGRRDADYEGEASVGFATKVKSQYFGVYYTGNGFPGWGSKTNEGGDDDKDEEFLEGSGQGQFALLWGGPIGGFRLDLTIPEGKTTTEKSDGNLMSATSKDGFLTALTWGNEIKGKPVSASLGVLGPKKTTTAIGDGKNTVDSKGGAFFLRGTIAEVSAGPGALGGDLRLAFGFKDTFKNEADEKQNTEEGGSFLLDGTVNYTLTPTSGAIELTVTPNLYAAFWSTSGKSKVGDTETDTGSTSGVELKPYVDVNVAAGPFKKFTFYTGLRLVLLDFYTTSKSAGDEDNESTSSYWQLDALSLGNPWDGDDASQLRVGAKWDISKNVALGADITSLVGNFVKFNPQTFTVEPGNFWSGFVLDNAFLAFVQDDAFKFNLGLTVKF